MKLLIPSTITQDVWPSENCCISINFEEIQQDFDLIYSPTPDLIWGKTLKIPYCYDLNKGFSEYSSFENYYSKISGAKRVFVCDKKLNKFATWLGLDTYWQNPQVDIVKWSFSNRKYFTPKLHIGCVYKDVPTFNLIKDLIVSKKSNWVFHIYLPPDLELGDSISREDVVLYHGDLEKAKLNMFKTIQVFLNLFIPKGPSLESFPIQDCLQAMSCGVPVISTNIHDNLDHLLFDKTQYFKIDFTDTNTVLDLLRAVDKRREKLERISFLGRSVVEKNCNEPKDEAFFNKIFGGNK